MDSAANAVDAVAGAVAVAAGVVARKVHRVRTPASTLRKLKTPVPESPTAAMNSRCSVHALPSRANLVANPNGVSICRPRRRKVTARAHRYRRVRLSLRQQNRHLPTTSSIRYGLPIRRQLPARGAAYRPERIATSEPVKAQRAAAPSSGQLCNQRCEIPQLVWPHHGRTRCPSTSCSNPSEASSSRSSTSSKPSAPP